MSVREALPPVALRDMCRDDLAAVLEIERRSFAQPWSRAFFEKELSTPFARLLVAEEEVAAARPVLVGYACRWRVTDEVHLLNVAVHPERRGLGTKIGEDKAGDFLDPVRRMPNTVLKGAVRRLGWLVEAAADRIVEPAVIAAADALIFHPAELQSGSAVRAVQIQQTEPSHTVTEEHEIFAQQPDSGGSARGFHILAESHRPPVAT